MRRWDNLIQLVINDAIVLTLKHEHFVDVVLRGKIKWEMEFKQKNNNKTILLYVCECAFHQPDQGVSDLILDFERLTRHFECA